MRSSILLSSVAVAALATPAFALPDRYEQGYSCTGMGFDCLQQEMRHDDGNRAFDKGNEGAVGGAGLAARGGADDDDDGLGNEIGEAADEAGDEISAAADEAGDEISEAADEAGDAIGDAFD